MKAIYEKIITSDFGKMESEIFVYLSEKNTNKVLFIIKGMYGVHVPLLDTNSKLKWDVQFVNHFTKDVHVVCLNTSNRGFEVTSEFNDRKKAYDGKTFQQEVGDIRKIIARVKDIYHSMGVENLEFYFFGKSFGGTLLLDLPEALEAKAVFMVGSGCGKSKTTSRTLLITMPEEEVLLKNISTYNQGKLYFFRGDLDDVVPKESQEKIVHAARKDLCEYIVLKGVDHEFEKENGVNSEMPGRVLLQKVVENIL